MEEYFIQNKTSSIVISHEVNPSARRKAKIKLIFGLTKKKNNQIAGVLLKGEYARFEYSGNIKTTYNLSIIYI